MNIVKITSPSEILANHEIAELVGMSLFKSTIGAVQNVAQGIYAQQQGRFYIAKEDDKIIGIIGMRKIANKRLVIQHLAFLEEYRGKGYVKIMMKEVCQLEHINEIAAEVNHTQKNYFKKSGFKVNLIENHITGQDLYWCKKSF
jgi:N-acetylglutamate synthase-like GNAT family acetyltransferase